MKCEYKAVKRPDSEDHTCHEEAKFKIWFGEGRCCGVYCEEHMKKIKSANMNHRIEEINDK